MWERERRRTLTSVSASPASEAGELDRSAEDDALAAAGVVVAASEAGEAATEVGGTGVGAVVAEVEGAAAAPSRTAPLPVAILSPVSSAIL